MTADVELQPPAAPWLGYDPERGDLHGFSHDEVRGIVAHATAAKDAELVELRSTIEALRAEVEKWEVPCREWMDKTEWVQQTAKVGELGMHRADVLRLRLEQAEARAERLAEALREIEQHARARGNGDLLQFVRAALNPTAAQENDDA